MSNRVAYFKGVDQAGLDENQSQLLVTIQGQYASLVSTVSNKADISSVDLALQQKADASALALKADAQDVTSALSTKANAQDVNTALGLKADSSAVAIDLSNVQKSLVGVNTALSGKANSSDITTINNNLSFVNSALANKLEASVFNTRVSNENQFFQAFKDVVYLSNANNTGEFDYSAYSLLPPVQ